MIDQKHNERNKSENKKVIMKEEYEKWKKIYEQQYKFMREKKSELIPK